MIRTLLASAATADTASEAAKAAPPIAVSGLMLAGVTLQDWALLVTIAYTLLQFGLLIRRTIKDYRNKKL